MVNTDAVNKAVEKLHPDYFDGSLLEGLRRTGWFSPEQVLEQQARKIREATETITESVTAYLEVTHEMDRKRALSKLSEIEEEQRAGGLCPRCNGTGLSPVVRQPVPCGECEGNGYTE